jgi:cob(I)alamin adenosyltransferase
MPKITRIYTRGGDKGKTSLGGGQRVPKHALRIQAYGTVDELNSQIGLAIASGLDEELAGLLQRVQNELFHLGSDLCILEEDKAKFQVPRIEQRHIDALEKILDRLTAEVGPLENFILPGGTSGAAHLHVARTVCRRAERLLVELADQEPVGKHTVGYLNRLSDALFVLGRCENKRRGVPETTWDSRA